jgi:hypothetical protein
VGDETPTELVEEFDGVLAAGAVVGEGTDLGDGVEAVGRGDVPTRCPLGIDALGQLDLEESGQLGRGGVEIDASAHTARA